MFADRKKKGIEPFLLVPVLFAGGYKSLVTDYFTDPNDTSLHAHSPDLDVVGSGWTERVGDFDIQGNRATNQGAAGVGSLASIPAGKSDVIIDAIIYIGSADGGDNNGIIARRDAVNGYYWHVRISSSGDEIQLYEMDGSPTKRASAAVVIDVETDYDLRMICKGTNISGFVDGGNMISYASASQNQSETVHGIRIKQDVLINTKAKVDNFLIQG